MITTQRIYAMLGNESLWEVVAHCHDLLGRANIAHSICGGVAVCLHGYQRNTTDVDLIIGRADASVIKQILESDGYVWDEQHAEFRSPGGIVVQFLIAGEKAGKDSEVTIPEPIGELNVEMRDGLSVVKLSRLIEMKLASGIGNLRRTHKDFADVVELIAIHGLDKSFARLVHKSVRAEFRELVRHARG